MDPMGYYSAIVFSGCLPGFFHRVHGVQRLESSADLAAKIWSLFFRYLDVHAESYISMDWFAREDFNRNPPYLMVKTMVSG